MYTHIHIYPLLVHRFKIMVQSPRLVFSCIHLDPRVGSISLVYDCIYCNELLVYPPTEILGYHPGSVTLNIIYEGPRIPLMLRSLALLGGHR